MWRAPPAIIGRDEAERLTRESLARSGKPVQLASRNTEFFYPGRFVFLGKGGSGSPRFNCLAHRRTSSIGCIDVAAMGDWGSASLGCRLPTRALTPLSKRYPEARCVVFGPLFRWEPMGSCGMVSHDSLPMDRTQVGTGDAACIHTSR